MAADLQLSSRLGCQVVIERPGEIVVEIPAWNRNYVSEGGESMMASRCMKAGGPNAGSPGRPA